MTRVKHAAMDVCPDLHGRVALVTGGGAGLGLRIAEALSNCGARVVVNDVDIARARAGAEMVGSNAAALAGDISSEREADHVVEKAFGLENRLDILVNNAGISEPIRATVRQELDVWRRVMDVNVQGTFLMSRAAAIVMGRQRRGAIINIASVAGLSPFSASNAYGVSKAAVVMLTKTMACDLARLCVRVNAVAPGVIEAPMATALWDQMGQMKDLFLRRIPMGRFGDPDEVARTVAFLASDWASYITGAVIPVDGGWSAFGGIDNALSTELRPDPLLPG